MNRECKKCLLYESAEADMLAEIKSRINKLTPQERADDDVYSHRLALCQQCDNLISGVCMKCGCYVEFRAAFIKQKCPDTRDRKW